MSAPRVARYAARLEAQGEALDALLAERDDADLERRPSTGAWNAREQIAHLARYHEIFLDRLRRMLEEPVPPRFGRYRAEGDPDFAPFLELPAAAVRARFAERRAALLRRVAALDDGALERTGIHPAFGEMPLSLWIEFFLAHEGHHLYVILQRVRDRGTIART